MVQCLFTNQVVIVGSSPVAVTFIDHNFVFFCFFIIELTHSKTILEIPVEIEPQPAALDFKNLSQCSSRSK